MNWLTLALLSAAAAAVVPIFGKLGMDRVDPTLATTMRSIVMTVALLAMSMATGAWSKTSGLGGRAMWMILLSGMAGAASWLFYFRAVQIGPVAQVSAVDRLSVALAAILAVAILRERPAAVNWLGIGLIVLGVYLAALPARS